MGEMQQHQHSAIHFLNFPQQAPASPGSSFVISFHFFFFSKPSSHSCVCHSKKSARKRRCPQKNPPSIVHQEAQSNVEIFLLLLEKLLRALTLSGHPLLPRRIMGIPGFWARARRTIALRYFWLVFHHGKSRPTSPEWRSLLFFFFFFLPILLFKSLNQPLLYSMV